MRFPKSAAVLARHWRSCLGAREPHPSATPLPHEELCARAPWPEIGTTLVDVNGVEWTVRAVVYDEAGPERVFVASAAEAGAAAARACSLDMASWGSFCAGKQVLLHAR